MQVTVLIPIVHRGMEHGLKFPVRYRFPRRRTTVGWLREQLGKKKLQSSTQKYRTPLKLQNEIKKNYCCFKV